MYRSINFIHSVCMSFTRKACIFYLAATPAVAAGGHAACVMQAVLGRKKEDKKETKGGSPAEKRKAAFLFAGFLTGNAANGKLYC